MALILPVLENSLKNERRSNTANVTTFKTSETRTRTAKKNFHDKERVARNPRYCQSSQTSLSPTSSQHMYLLGPIKTLQTVIDSVGDEELGQLLWKDIFQPLSMDELIKYRRREALKAAMKLCRIQI